MQSGEKRVGYLGKQQEAHSQMDGCLLVLNSLDFRPPVMHQCQDQLCLICHERKHKNNRPTISYIFAFCIHERDLNSGTLSLHSYTGPFMNTFSSTKKDTENVSSVLLDDFGHFLGRFLRNFAEEFFKSGNFTAKQILKHSTFPRLFPRIFVGKGLQMRFSQLSRLRNTVFMRFQVLLDS